MKDEISNRLPYEPLGNEWDYPVFLYQRMVPNRVRERLTFGEFVELLDSIPHTLRGDKEKQL